MNKMSYLRRKFIEIVKTVIYLIKKQATNNVHLFQQAIKSLIKQEDDRNFYDTFIIEQMMLQLDFPKKVLATHGYDVFSQFCKYLYYRKAERGKKLIQVKKENKTFYIILDGKVSVNIYLKKQNNIQQNNDEQQQNDQLELTQVNVLGQGQAFGELALLDPNSRATATIFCIIDSEFACIDKKNYIHVLGIYKQQEQLDKINFLRRLPFMSDWHDIDLKTISYHFKVQHYRFDNFVFKEQDEVDGFYLVKQGEFRIYKKLKNKNIEISSLDIGESFGEEEYVGIEQSRVFTVQCKGGDGEIYYINKDEFQRRMNQTNHFQIFMKIVKQKFQYRLDRFKMFALKIKINLQKPVIFNIDSNSIQNSSQTPINGMISKNKEKRTNFNLINAKSTIDDFYQQKHNQYQHKISISNFCTPRAQCVVESSRKKKTFEQIMNENIKLISQRSSHQAEEQMLEKFFLKTDQKYKNDLDERTLIDDIEEFMQKNKMTENLVNDQILRRFIGLSDKFNDLKSKRKLIDDCFFLKKGLNQKNTEMRNEVENGLKQMKSQLKILEYVYQILVEDKKLNMNKAQNVMRRSTITLEQQHNQVFNFLTQQQTTNYQNLFKQVSILLHQIQIKLKNKIHTHPQIISNFSAAIHQQKTQIIKSKMHTSLKSVPSLITKQTSIVNLNDASIHIFGIQQ